MSKPTGDGDQKPDQDPEQTSGSVFDDPTAPFWDDPTFSSPTPRVDDAPSVLDQDAPPEPPAPPAPPAPPGGAYPFGQQPTTPQGSTPAAPPMGNPYAQQPPVQQYGQPSSQYGQPQPTQPHPPYGQQPSQPQPPYGQQPSPPYPAYGQQAPAQQYGQPNPGYGTQTYGTGATGGMNGSAIALTILSFFTLCNPLTLASLVFGIIALTKSSTDPEGSRQMTKIGWIIFAVVWVLAILGFVLLAIAGSFADDPSRSVPDSTF